MPSSLIVSSWDNYLENLPICKQDIYLKENYLDLNSRNGVAECFLYQDKSNLWLFPYIKRKIEGEDNIWDFESQYGYGGPVSNSDDQEFLRKAQNEFCKVLKEAGGIAGLVKFHPLFDNYLLLKDISRLFYNRHTVGVELSSEIDTIWFEQVHSKHRNSIRKAENSGVEFLIDPEFNFYDEFRNLYLLTMKKADADSFYMFDDDYFRRLKESFQKESLLAHALFEGKIISSSVFLYSNNYAHYHLAGSNPDFLPLNPNCFLIYRTIEHFKKEGKKILHLGGGTDSDPNNSLYRFKMRFSKKMYDFYIGEIVLNTSIYNELCSAWASSNPEKALINSQKLLKYRF